MFRKLSLTRSVVFMLMLMLVVVHTNGFSSNDHPKPIRAVQKYSSPLQEGLIGVTTESPVDNPADNIFHVQVSEALCGNETVWLIYDLNGVNDYSNVSRSVNDQLAVGGYFVRKHQGWQKQRERIDVKWLKSGDNIVRFTLPENAQHSYRIKNLSLEVEKPEENGEAIRRLVIDKSMASVYGGYVYMKGFVVGEGSQQAKITIDGQAARMFNGEFESVNTVSHALSSGQISEVRLEVIYPDGFSICQQVEVKKETDVDYAYVWKSRLSHTEKIFAAKEAGSIALSGATLVTEAGSLAQTSLLSITALRDVDIPALDAGMVNVTRYHDGFRFLPHGMKFTSEVQLHLPFDPAKIPDGYTGKDIRTYYFDEQSHHWVAVTTDSVTDESSELWSKTNHFTDFINAIIKVPESPEVNAYNSTSMKGIKAANPTAGVNLINPPQANNSGSASLSYPINIPAGRNGMKPQLGISYNSGGGNGWLGLGWNLTIPSITIDTRWGAPRYDTDKETETYSFNGEMLTPVAHRGELQDRTPDKQFYPRIEGSFQRIIRRGDNPSNYYWEVTDKSGTKYFYGGDENGADDEASTLNGISAITKTTNNKAYWPLRKVIDLNGNYVLYNYKKEENVGLEKGKVPGYQLYVTEITYTHHSSGSALYKVKFTRKTGRSDVQISGNLGFKMVTADLLERIDVTLEESPPKTIRSYRLEYLPGEFNKTLLRKITEVDAAGDDFTTHEFDYYDEVKNGSGFKPLGTERGWSMPGDDINGKFRTPLAKLGDITPEATALSGTKSSDKNIGVSVGVGLGFNVFSKMATGAVSLGYAEGESEAMLMMIDMNGDGLQDKVFVKNGLWYRPNLSRTEEKFATEVVPITGEGINAIFYEKSRTTSLGAEVSIGAFAGYSHTWTTNQTKVYFTDVNGDGLPDIVKNGVVFFNHLDPETGAVTYTRTSAGTPNGIVAGGAMSSDLMDRAALESEREQAIDQNPLLDIVKMWKAPYDGQINVTAPVQLLQSDDPKRAEAPADGVRVAIQLRDTPLWDAHIDGNDYNVYTPTGVTNLTVNRGDKLFFRVGSRDNGQYDSVRWEPVIEYVNQPLDLKDANNKKIYQFSAKEGYLLSSNQTVAPPLDGQIKVTGLLNKPVTTDDVELLMIKKDSLGTVLDTVWRKKYLWNETVSQFPEASLAVKRENELYTFKVITGSNIDWNAFQFQPKLSYESVDGGSVDLAETPIEVSPVAEYSLYVNPIRISKSFRIALDSAGQRDTLKINPQLLFSSRPDWMPPFTGEMTFTAKKADTLLAKQVLIIHDSVLMNPDSLLTVPVKHGDDIFVEYHIRDAYLAGGLTQYNATFKIRRTDKDTQLIVEKDTVVYAGLHTVFPTDEHQTDVVYGPLYRGWGHFGWNGNRDWEEQAIDVNKIFISEKAKTSNPEKINVSSGEELESTPKYDASKDNFFVLVGSGKDQRWISGDQYAWLSADVISSSRLGADDLSVIEPSIGTGEGTGAYGIDKISKSTGDGYSFGALVAGYSHSSGHSRVLTDFMDMNGDRYPDVVSEKVIQYTDMRGGLSNIVVPSKGEVSKSHATTDSYNLSGSFPMAMPKFRDGIKKTREPQNDAGDAASLKGSVSASVGSTTGTNDTKYTWMDVNGDGLPDRIELTDGGKVALNLGYTFAEAEEWSFGPIQEGSSNTKTGGASLGFSKGRGSISVGFSLAKSSNESGSGLMDINGDGLPDKVEKGSPAKVWINTGNSFVGPISWDGASVIGENATASESLNASFTIGFTIPTPTGGIKFTVTPSGSVSRAVSRDLSKFMDMNGDGYPDLVRSTKDNNLTVQLSTIGKTNLLKSVKRPLGASFAMDYERVGNTYDLPHSTWVVNGVEVLDGHADDGVDRMKTTFAYEGGKYNRHERESYGFSKVITRSHDTSKDNEPVYTTVTQTFANDNYYEKGLLLTEVMTDGNENKWVEKENRYELKTLDGGTFTNKASDADAAFPALVETSQKFYEGQSDAGKRTSMTYGYDKKGNIIKYNDLGDENGDDDLAATISYHEIDTDNKYLVGTPSAITVTGSGKTYRRRESVIDQETGNVKQIKQYLENGDVAVHDLEYDQYGNLSKMTRPANSKGERLSVEYAYDNTVHTYPIKVSNSYGYSSEAQYEFSFGQMLKSIDLNGNEISYEIDKLGRVTKIVGPYEQGGYTIKFEYHPEAETPWALTKHFDPSNPGNDLETSIFVDGLGRVLQTKKDIALYDGENKPDVEKMVVSGRVIFDAFGRTTKAWYPTTEDVGTPGEFKTEFDDIAPSETIYDVLNRTLSMILPDGSVTTTEYGFDSDNKGKKQFSTKTTDANGKQTQQFTDIRGRVSAVKNYTSEKDIWTSFVYNAINEQVEATDDLGYTTVSTYDNFGRRITRKHPDAGLTNYSYDLAGNITQLVTANLAKEGGVIEYKYDHERLTEIIYPQNTENNVKYTYGEAGATDNRAGRIVLQEDATGAQEFFYGPLGEVVKNIRTVVIPHFDEQSFETKWQYDTWNRLTSMTYADGEKVDYTYNVGGLLRSMSGKKKGDNYEYVKQLGYDKFEQRVFLAYGNGTKTTYDYEPERRRLKNMTAETSNHRLFMDNAYGYDKVNNILNLKNNAPVPSSNLMGGASEYSYSYDDLYRLTEATGTFKGSNEEHRYNLAMKYNSVGGILQKTQKHERSGPSTGSGTDEGNFTEQKKTTYDNNYTYSEEQPHAPVHIGRQAFTYDANGNQTGWTDDVSGQKRRIMWDEENRIRAIYDNGALYHYVYDASGERVLKGQGLGERVFVNGEQKAGSGQVGNYTVYVNPYLVLKSGGYTKHYYIEGQRIVSKLGGGWDNDGKGPIKAGGDKIDYNGKTQKLFEGIVKNLKFLGADGQILTAGKSGKIPPGQLNGNGGSTSTSESFRYFYHPDHLGSTSYVTDASGEVYQHLEYFAFGETFIEEHSNTDRTPYLFNGKEQDEETGLYYYGARYYDARTSVFLSIDPDAEIYAAMSPYVYAANNPIRFLDVLGRGPGNPENLKTAAKNAVEHVIKNYGTVDAYCNVGVSSAFKELTGSEELQGVNANGMVAILQKSKNFKEVKLSEVQDLANKGEIVIGAKAETDESGHVVMAVPGTEEYSTGWGGNVPQVMDTGKNKRTASKGVNYSWKGSAGKEVKWYVYTGEQKEGNKESKSGSAGTKFFKAFQGMVKMGSNFAKELQKVKQIGNSFINSVKPKSE